jgi:hypothetical protein
MKRQFVFSYLKELEKQQNNFCAVSFFFISLPRDISVRFIYIYIYILKMLYILVNIKGNY